MTTISTKTRPTRFACLSDLHGHLPRSIHDPATIDSFDALLIAGDVSPHPAKDLKYQRKWLFTTFDDWAYPITAAGKQIFMIAGNHDILFQEDSNWIKRWISSSHVWRGFEDLIYLQDTTTIYTSPTGESFRIHGSPWQPTFPVPRPVYNLATGTVEPGKPYWAFNLDEPALHSKWAAIPLDTDILITHGPPHGFGDAVERSDGVEHVGSPGLLARIGAVRPMLAVNGHIHGGYGRRTMAHRYRVKPMGCESHWATGETVVVNASLMDEDYRAVHEMIVVAVGGDRVESNTSNLSNSLCQVMGLKS